MLMVCMTDIVSLYSTGKVTILAARVSVPAWVRRQRQVRGFGASACWWGAGGGGQGGMTPCTPLEDRGESIQMPGWVWLKAPLFFGPKALRPCCGGFSGSGRQVVGGELGASTLLL